MKIHLKHSDIYNKMPRTNKAFMTRQKKKHNEFDAILDTVTRKISLSNSETVGLYKEVQPFHIWIRESGRLSHVKECTDIVNKLAKEYL